MQPFEVLYERPGLTPRELPPSLAERYGDGPSFPDGTVVANFVSSIDGIVDLDVPSAPSFISGRSEHDRFVMGLLRASAGAVLIGAGTLRAEPKHRWTPGTIFPEAAEGFAELRSALGLAPEPELVVVTASGKLDRSARALPDAVVVTGRRGTASLSGIKAREVIQIGDERVEPAAVLTAVRERGHDVILTEAGPGLNAQLLDEGLLDELFLTVSPVVLGRTEGQRRASLADGRDLVSAGPPGAELLGVRRGGDHLLLRYAISGPR